MHGLTSVHLGWPWYWRWSSESLIGPPCWKRSKDASCMIGRGQTKTKSAELFARASHSFFSDSLISVLHTKLQQWQLKLSREHCVQRSSRWPRPLIIHCPYILFVYIIRKTTYVELQYPEHFTGIWRMRRRRVPGSLSPPPESEPGFEAKVRQCPSFNRTPLSSHCRPLPCMRHTSSLSIFFLT